MVEVYKDICGLLLLLFKFSVLLMQLCLQKHIEVILDRNI